MAISHLYPNSSNRLNYNFANSGTLDPSLSFTRAGSATYVDKDGYVKTAPQDVARFAHHPGNGDCLGVLLEETVTNVQANSDIYTAYNKTNATMSSTSVITPSGELNAQLMTENTVNGSHILWDPDLLTSSTLNCFSVFVKPNGRTWIRLLLSQLVVTGNIQCWFNLVGEGSIGTNNTTALTSETVGIQKYNNGWYRVWVAASGFDGTNQVRPHIYLATADNDGGIYTGDNVSGIYVWGWQVEANNGPTSLIRTSGSTASRANDALLLTGNEYDKKLKTFSEATILCDFTFQTQSNSNEFVYSIGEDLLIDNGWSMYRNGSGLWRGVAVDGGISNYTGQVFSDEVDIFRYAKTAFASESEISTRFCLNGTLSGSDTPAEIYSNFNNIKFGARSNTSFRSHSIIFHRFSIISERVDNEILINITK